MPSRPTSARLAAPHTSTTLEYGEDNRTQDLGAEASYRPTMEYTTGRRGLHVPTNAIGSDTHTTAPKTAAGISDQQKQLLLGAQLVYQQKSRPHSSRVQAAAFRAYGSLNAKGLCERPLKSSTMPFVNTSTSVIESIKAHRPSSAILGGGYHLPTSRPQTAHAKFSRREPHYVSATFEATPDGPLLSGPHMADAPALQRPMSAGPTLMSTQQSMFRTSSFQDATGHEQRFLHTLPTDPNAHRVWERLTRRPDFVPPEWPTQKAQQSCSLSSSPRTSLQRCLGRPLSGQSTRFGSTPVMENQAAAGTQPVRVSGYSAPERELAVPHAGSAWWQTTRLGNTAIRTIDTKLKMTVATSLPSSDTQRMHVVKGAQLSPLKPLQPAPHVVSLESEHRESNGFVQDDDMDGGCTDQQEGSGLEAGEQEEGEGHGRQEPGEGRQQHSASIHTTRQELQHSHRDGPGSRDEGGKPNEGHSLAQEGDLSMLKPSDQQFVANSSSTTDEDLR